MKDAIIAIAILVLLIVGFWWTRGAALGPKDIGSFASDEHVRYNELGDHMAQPGEEHEDREHEIE